ncbi:MAG: GtrA family protein [Bacteroidales bacterium]|nr:GtrA family protein [Bacteroidales bacterium]MBQ7818785.1 GtrA family protein [Bacteroidales bacterium]
MVETQSKKRHRGEVLRFAITGALVTFILYAVYLPLSYIMPNYVGIAYSIGFIVSFITNFVLSNYYTFRTKPTIDRAILFCIVQFINYMLQIICFKFFIWIGVSNVWAPVPVWAFIFPINFLLMRVALKSASIKDLMHRIMNIERRNINTKD